jgi:ABC-type transport system substrate-binding protein
MESRRLVLVLTGIAVALVIVIGGLSLAVIAGGGDDDGTGGDPPPATLPPGEATPLPERVQGEFRLFGPDPITLDPACASDAASAQYIVEVFSGLVSFDRDLNLIPDIASEWDISEDGTVYTFHLRSNVLFHDGSRRVTASDFKFSMERALNPATQSTVGEVYLDDIVGAQAFVSGEASEVTGIRVVDDNTLEITIDAPKSYFLDKLSYPTAYVVDRREVGDSTCFRGADWTRRPNGTGPFRLTDVELGQRIELEANGSYYLDPKASLAKVTYFLAGGSALVMYENDEIDLTGVGINDIERIRDASDPLNAEFVELASMDTFYIGFNAQAPPFNDVRVRQALAMAIDKELLADNILKELVVPANGVLPPGISGFNPNLTGLPHDPEGARALLDDAGGPDLLKDIVLLTSGQGASVGPILDALLAMWDQNLGVTVAVEQEDFGLFLRDLDQGDFQMFSLGWIADYPDPQNFLDIKLHSQSDNNETAYSNPQVDQLLEQARIETDEATRLRLYQQAEEIIVQEAPWIPLYHGKANALIKPYVDGYVVPPFVIPNLRYISISR